MNIQVDQKLQEIINGSKTITAVALELGVSRQTVYKWLHKQKRAERNEKTIASLKKAPPAHNKIRSEIESLVIATAKKYPEDSVLRLASKLQQEYKVVLNATTIFRILKRNNIRYSATLKEEKVNPAVASESANSLSAEDTEQNSVVSQKVAETVDQISAFTSQKEVLPVVNEMITAPATIIKSSSLFSLRSLATGISSLVLAAGILYTTSSLSGVLPAISTLPKYLEIVAGRLVSSDSGTALGEVLGVSTSSFESDVKRKTLPFLDIVSLQLYCTFALPSAARNERCDYETLVAESSAEKAIVTTPSTPVAQEVATAPQSDNAAKRLAVYVNQAVTKYVPVPGAPGPSGPSGTPGTPGRDGRDAKDSQGGFGGFVYPTYTASTQSLVGVSTIGYLNNATIDSSLFNGGTATNMLFRNGTINNSLFTGSNIFNDNAYFTGNVVINNLTATSSLITYATTTNSYIENLVVGNATTTNGFVSNFFASSGTTTNAYIASLTASSSTLFDVVMTYASTTYATTTNSYARNFFADNSSSTNAYIGNLQVGTSSANSLTLTGALTVGGTSTLATTTLTDLLATNATTTSLYASLVNAVTTFITNLQATNATTTNFFATNGFTTNSSSTNIFTQNLAVGNASTTGNQSVDGSFSVSGTSTLGANVFLNGNVVVGTSTSQLFTVNALINSSLTPASNKTYDLGSNSFYWRNLYADNINVNSISAASTTISGTSNNDFTINSDNGTTDTEDIALVFFRGLVTPNALVRWNATTKRLETNQSLKIQNETPSIGSTTLTVQAGVGQGTYNLLEILNNAGTKLSAFTSQGWLGIGSTTPSSALTVIGNTYLGGNVTATGTLNISGTSTLATTTATTLTVSGQTTLSNASSTNFTSSGATVLTNATSTNFFSTLLNAVTAIFTNLTATNATTTNLVSTNSTTTLLAAVTASTTNLTALTATVTNGTITNASTTNLTVANNAYFGGNTGIWNGSGNVGVGTTNPNAKLHVLGSDTLPVYVSTSDTAVYVRFLTGSTISRGAFGYTSTGAAFLNAALNATNMTILDGGNVGIGTTTPGTKLYVAGGAIALDAAQRIDFSGGNSQTFIRRDTANNGLSFFANALPRLFVGDNGNVGVGTSTPGGKFDVISDTSVASPESSAMSRFVSSNNNDSPLMYLEQQRYNKDVLTIRQAQTSASSTLIKATSADGGMFVVTNGGAVGIGTTTPFRTLEVAGANTDALGIRIGVANTSASESYDFYRKASDGIFQFVSNQASSGGFNWFTNTGSGTTSRMVLTNAGNIGIGTTTPGSTLTVSGTTGLAGSLNITGQIASTDTSGNFLINNPTGTGPRSIRMGNSGGDVYFGREGSSAGGFFSGSLAYSSVVYSDTALQTIVGGVSRMIVDTSGNVGIGTTTPSRLLDLYGTGSWSGTGGLRVQGNNPGIEIADLASGNKWLIANGVDTASDGKLGLAYDIDAAAHRIVVDGTGKVGIGTSAPNQKLTVQGNASLYTTDDSTGQTSLLLGSSASMPQGIALVNGVKTAAGSGYLALSTGSSGVLAEKVRIDSTGNVGIGTTNPNYQTQIYGSGQQTAALTDAGAAGGSLFLNTPTVNAGDGGALLIGAGGTGNKPFAAIKGLLTDGNANTVGDLAFSTRNSTAATALTERMRILADGKVGIGVSDPRQLLEVAGNVSVGRYTASDFTRAVGITDSTGAYGGGASYIRFSEESGSGTLNVNKGGNIDFYNHCYACNTNLNMRIQANGNVGIGTASPSGKLEVIVPSTAAATSIGRISDYSGATYFTRSTNLGKQALVFRGSDTIGSVIETGRQNEAVDWGTYFAFRTRNENTSGNVDEVTEKMRITGNGNVSIGTTNPAGYKLNVAGTGYYGGQLTVDGFGNNVGISFRDGFDPTNVGIRAKAIASGNRDGLELLGYNGIDMSINNGGTVAMHIDGTGAANPGYVGIGTTAPSAKLEVNGDLSLRTNSTNGYVYLAPGGATSQGYVGFYKPGPTRVGYMGYTDGSGTNNLAVTLENSANFIVNGGNVGIATTAPTEKLDINGVLRVSSDTQQGIIALGNRAQGAGYYDTGIYRGALGSVAVGNILNLGGYDGIAFNSSNAPFGSQATRMYVDGTTGSVGIGTTAPNKNLEIKGTAGQGTNAGALIRLEPTTNVGAVAGDKFGLQLTADGSGDRVVGIYNMAKSTNSWNDPVLAFWASGTSIPEREVMRIDGLSGNVGIGTTNPSSKLVVSNGGAGGLEFAGGSSAFGLTNAGYILSYDRSGSTYRDVALDLGGSAATGVFFKAGGNVGVGVTDPASKLEVNGNITLGSKTTTSATNIGPANNPGAHSAAVVPTTLSFGSGAALVYNAVRNGANTFNNEFLTFNTHEGGVSVGERMRIAANGYVGIGTTAPNSPLHVVGNLSVSGNGATNGGMPGMAQITTGGASPFLNRLTYGTDGTGYKFAISKNQSGTVTDQIVVQDNGDVGIGTSNPSSRLNISTSNSTYSATGNALLRIDNTSATGQSPLDFFINGTLRGRVRSDYAGNMNYVTNGGDHYFYTGGDSGVGTSPAVFKASGNIGLGNSAPQSRLDLGTGTGAKLLWYNDNNASALAGTKGGIYLDQFSLSNNTTAVFTTAAANPGTFVFASKDSGSTTLVERMRVEGETGNVGIGVQGVSPARLGVYSPAGSTIFSAYTDSATVVGNPVKDTGTANLGEALADHNGGYRFTPLVNGSVTQLGARCASQSGTVRLYNMAGTVLASAAVTTTGTGNWVYTSITPVSLSAGTSYVVAFRGTSMCYTTIATPATYGDIIIEDGRYIAGSNAIPTGVILANEVYGTADITFSATSPAEKLIVKATGNVGIGVASPGTKLDVAGSVRQSGAKNCALSTNASGELICTSDERLKDVAGVYEGGLSQLEKINPIRFNYKNETYQHVGFSAQNIFSVLPEGAPVQNNGFYGLDSNAVIALTVNAAKELSMRQQTDTQTVTPYYPDEAVDAGTIVTFSSSLHQTASTSDVYTTLGIQKAQSTDSMVGIVVNSSTTTRAYLGGTIPVQSSGRALVKVTTENGEVHAGDYLTISTSMPGHAMKLTGDGIALGRAVSNYVPGREKVMMLIQNGYQRMNLGNNNASTTAMLTTGNIDLNANGVAITNIKSLASANGTWSIDENGKITAKSLCIDGNCLDGQGLGDVIATSKRTGAIQIIGTNAYLLNAKSHSLRVVDMINQDSPVLLATLVMDEGVATIASSGNMLYIANDDMSKLYIVDISNPSSPTILRNVDVTGNSTIVNLPPSGDGGFLAGGDGGEGGEVAGTSTDNFSGDDTGSSTQSGDLGGDVPPPEAPPGEDAGGDAPSPETPPEEGAGETPPVVE